MLEMNDQKRDAIAQLCRRYRIQRLDLFGSAGGTNFDPDRSDLDFLVRFRPDFDLGPWMSGLQEFKEGLVSILQRPVDVVMDSALRNPWFRREAEKTRTLIYDAFEDAKMASGRS